MDTDHRPPDFSGKNLIIILLIALILSAGLPTFELNNQKQRVFSYEGLNNRPIAEDLITIQENTLISAANLFIIPKPKAKMVQISEPEVIERIKMTITAYSSTPCQTDDTPFITASNSWVRDGIVANNYFPFGTRIRIPEYFGDKIFVIEDRMHWRKSDHQVDVWFPAKQQAINFGITRAYVEILED